MGWRARVMLGFLHEIQELARLLAVFGLVTKSEANITSASAATIFTQITIIFSIVASKPLDMFIGKPF
jgi:hypothetical protein